MAKRICRQINSITRKAKRSVRIYNAMRGPNIESITEKEALDPTSELVDSRTLPSGKHHKVTKDMIKLKGFKAHYSLTIISKKILVTLRQYIPCSTTANKFGGGNVRNVSTDAVGAGFGDWRHFCGFGVSVQEIVQT